MVVLLYGYVSGYRTEAANPDGVKLAVNIYIWPPQACISAYTQFFPQDKAVLND